MRYARSGERFWPCLGIGFDPALGKGYGPALSKGFDPDWGKVMALGGELTWPPTTSSCDSDMTILRISVRIR